MGLGVPLDWLIFGDVDGDNCHRVINVDYFDRSYQAATFVDDDEQVVSPDFSGNQPDCEYIPLYDIQVSAGAGAEVYGEHVIQRIPFSKSWLYSENLHAENLACLKVAGDSMLPTLDDSDIVLVNHAKTLGDGVFVLRIGNMLRIKRLQWLTGGKLRISSDNPIYEAEQVNLNEFAESEFAILGFCHTKIGRVI